MGSAIRKIRSAGRLALGAVQLPLALLRGRKQGGWQLISVDVFATLLVRSGDDDAAWQEGTHRAAELARCGGTPEAADIESRRREIEQRLSRELCSSGRDPEFPHQLALTRLLCDLGAGKQTDGDELAAWELEREAAYTRPVLEMAAQVRRWEDSRIRVVAVSDTRYTAPELATLLSHHGISGLAAIYSSADHGASKFSGRLFDHVARLEGVSPGKTLHVGDDLISDALSAAQRGLAVRMVRRPAKPALLPHAPPLKSREDPFFAIGYQTLGPVLVAFARLLFHRAQQDGVRRLAFVARDGELLLRVAQCLAASSGGPPFTLSYLHLSRRAVACASPELRALHSDPDAIERVLATLQSIRGMGTAMDGFRSFFNLPAEMISRHAARLHAEDGGIAAVRRLLSDPIAAIDLASAVAPMRERLRRYLLQEGVCEEPVALVDIGWRGSLQKILHSEWQACSPHALRGYYLGLWDENGRDFPRNAIGLLGDQRRGRSLQEGAAWHAAFLLEAVCRAKHGMVTGFADDANGNVLPVHLEQGKTRDAERASEGVQEKIQEGVIAYAQWFARSCPLRITCEDGTRLEAQRSLLRLAFFPTPNERSMGHSLAYSEPTSDESEMWLICHPGNSLRGRISGLRSPWKGGYLRETCGFLPAAIYCAVEGLLSQMPSGTKPAIRRWLLHE